MILINLLPTEFRKTALHDPRMRGWIRVFQASGALFVVLTLIFYVQYLFASRTLKTLQTQWQSLEVDAQRVQQMKDEMAQGSGAEIKFLETYITSTFRTSQILTGVSALLPDSMWLIELRLVRQPQNASLLIKGMSFPGIDRTSVQEIEKYLGDLKAKLPENVDLVLTTSRQQKNKAESTFFTAIFKWV